LGDMQRCTSLSSKTVTAKLLSGVCANLISNSGFFFKDCSFLFVAESSVFFVDQEKTIA